MTKKVLCLHGYSMNREWFKEQCAVLQEQLNGAFEFIYAQGPIVCPEEEVRAIIQQYNIALPERRIGSGKNWCWYRASSDKPPHYSGIQASLKTLTALCKKEGGIDGVIGWSQGCTIAAIIAAQSALRDESCIKINWAVLCGGFIPRDRRYQGLFTTPIELPTLHVIGCKESESMQARSTALRAAFAGSDRLDTSVGHTLPIKYPEEMKAISDWIRAKESP